MAIEKLFTEQDIQNLIDMNNKPLFAARNQALIMGAVCWGLTPIELSLLTLGDVMAQNGEFKSAWVLPISGSYNGEARELRTEDHLVKPLENYMRWRIKNGCYLTNINWYQGCDPKSHFFLNDRLEPFKLSPKSKDDNGYYVARSMTEKLKSFIANTGIRGATPATFRDSFIKAMFENGCGYKELMSVTGIKEKATLDRRILPHVRELEHVFKTVFARVKI